LNSDTTAFHGVLYIVNITAISSAAASAAIGDAVIAAAVVSIAIVAIVVCFCRRCLPPPLPLLFADALPLSPPLRLLTLFLLPTPLRS